MLHIKHLIVVFKWKLPIPSVNAFIRDSNAIEKDQLSKFYPENIE